MVEVACPRREGKYHCDRSEYFFGFSLRNPSLAQGRSLPNHSALSHCTFSVLNNNAPPATQLQPTSYPSARE